MRGQMGKALLQRATTAAVGVREEEKAAKGRYLLQGQFFAKPSIWCLVIVASTVIGVHLAQPSTKAAWHADTSSLEWTFAMTAFWQPSLSMEDDE
jgi:hypothetical protein